MYLDVEQKNGSMKHPKWNLPVLSLLPPSDLAFPTAIKNS